MTLEQLLISLGINIASNTIYDFIKNKILENNELESIKNDLVNFLHIENANIKAEKIIEFLAKNGDVKIEGTHVYGKEGVTLGSNPNTKFIFGNNSISKTYKTSIEAGNGAFIQGQGGAKISQKPDGSISFYT